MGSKAGKRAEAIGLAVVDLGASIRRQRKNRKRIESFVARAQ